MFSYQINMRKISKPGLKIKGIASIVIDDIMSIDGFKIIEGSNGLFVSVPNHKGTVMEEGVKVDKYFDDVRFIGEEGISFSQELKNAILDSYHSSKPAKDSSPTESRAAAANAHVKKAKPKKQVEESIQEEEEEEEEVVETPKSKAPSRTRKPIWDFG